VHEWREHTGELELHIAAATERDVFGEATSAIAEVLGESDAAETVVRRIAVSAPDQAALLADWLTELVWLAERECLIPRRLTDFDSDGETARGSVELLRGQPRELVKAVTYHGLECQREGDGWRASVVFDV
jgi:SHS2 domain-containing protein